MTSVYYDLQQAANACDTIIGKLKEISADYQEQIKAFSTSDVTSVGSNVS